MQKFTPEQLDAIKKQANLIELAASITSLRQIAEGQYVAECPFHEERTASFHVNAERYHCFGCHAHGDVFSFLCRVHNVKFPIAVRMITGDTTIKVGPIKQRNTRNYSDYDAEKALNIIETNAEAHKLFYNNFEGWPADVVDYVRSRFGGICGSEDAGYADSDRGRLPEILTANDIPWDLQVASALCAENENGDRYGRYCERITLPLRSRTGHILGFLGRSIPGRTNSKAPKYLNPPATAAFERKRYLYGLDRLEDKPRSIIVVEGVIDAIRMLDAGIPNVVASLGCNLTKEQVNVLEYYTDTVVICYDGDMPGLVASANLSRQLLSSTLNVKHLLLPHGQDPDNWVSTFANKADALPVLRQLPIINMHDFLTGVMESKAIKKEYDRSILDELAKPYVADNIKQGWPHYNVIDWVCVAYPQFADEIKGALKDMTIDVEAVDGKLKLKRERVVVFLRAWMKPCREVRNAHK